MRFRAEPDELGRPIGFGTVGFGSVQDDAGRAKHDIDVIATENGGVRLIGEAKATLARRGLPDLERLDGISGVLARTGHDTTGLLTVLFSATGFTTDLARTVAARADVILVDLPRLYGLT